MSERKLKGYAVKIVDISSSDFATFWSTSATGMSTSFVKSMR